MSLESAVSTSGIWYKPINTDSTIGLMFQQFFIVGPMCEDSVSIFFERYISGRDYCMQLVLTCDVQRLSPVRLGVA